MTCQKRSAIYHLCLKKTSDRLIRNRGKENGQIYNCKENRPTQRKKVERHSDIRERRKLDSRHSTCEKGTGFPKENKHPKSNFQTQKRLFSCLLAAVWKIMSELISACAL